ncbi:MAG TPA: T9SS type A sorting domain-containing protein, partial [Bacteroidia bacterium]|nr:T9SS type A sorting domain-containing protein [Bacteroidia bacterium]
DWGYGKIDAYSMMANCATSMSVETPEVNSGIVVYPVPADQSQPITLQLQASEMNAVVEIYNAAGQLVFTGTTGSDGKLVVPAGILSSGMYNAVANGNEGVATSRFIIQ